MLAVSVEDHYVLDAKLRIAEEFAIEFWMSPG